MVAVARARPADPGFCTPGTLAIVGFQARPEDCSGEDCRYYRLVPLARGETVRVVGRDMPEGAGVQLQIHERLFFEDRWTPVAREPLVDEEPVILKATLSAWYWLAYEIPGASPADIVRVCAERPL